MLLSLVLVFSLSSIPASAANKDATSKALLKTTGSLEGSAISDEDSKMATKLVMREFVRYDASLNQRINKYFSLGSVIGTNNTPNPLTISFSYQTSSSVTTTLGNSISSSTTIDAVIAEVSFDTALNLAVSRSWVQGTSSGASLVLPAYTTATISGYIPGVSTQGSLVYYAYPDSSYSSGWYEYVSLSKSYIPIADEVYLEAN